MWIHKNGVTFYENTDLWMFVTFYASGGGGGAVESIKLSYGNFSPSNLLNRLTQLKETSFGAVYFRVEFVETLRKIQLQKVYS